MTAPLDTTTQLSRLLDVFQTTGYLAKCLKVDVAQLHAVQRDGATAAVVGAIEHATARLDALVRTRRGHLLRRTKQETRTQHLTRIRAVVFG